jgi:hypothetical protein
MRRPRPGRRPAHLAAALLLVLSAAGLAACGDGGTGEQPTGASTSGAAGEPATAEPATTGDDPGATEGAGAGDEPELCEDLAVVRESVETMRGATVGEGAVLVVAEELLVLEPALRELRPDAAAQYETQVDDVEAGLEDVRVGVDAAQADPSAAALLEVTTAVKALGASVDALVDEVGDTC